MCQQKRCHRNSIFNSLLLPNSGCNDPFGFKKAWALLEGCWDEVNAESLDDHHHCDGHQGHGYGIQQPDKLDMEEQWRFWSTMWSSKILFRLYMKMPSGKLQKTSFRLPSISSKSTPSAQGNKTTRLRETCNLPRLLGVYDTYIIYILHLVRHLLHIPSGNVT